jgi:hypothetical protein
VHHCTVVGCHAVTGHKCCTLGLAGCRVVHQTWAVQLQALGNHVKRIPQQTCTTCSTVQPPTDGWAAFRVALQCGTAGHAAAATGLTLAGARTVGSRGCYATDATYGRKTQVGNETSKETTCRLPDGHGGFLWLAGTRVVRAGTRKTQHAYDKQTIDRWMTTKYENKRRPTCGNVLCRPEGAASACPCICALHACTGARRDPGHSGGVPLRVSV